MYITNPEWKFEDLLYAQFLSGANDNECAPEDCSVCVKRQDCETGMRTSWEQFLAEGYYPDNVAQGK